MCIGLINYLVILQFSKTILLEYRFEELQNLKFAVYDIDSKKHIEDVSKHDFIGGLECSLADIVTAGQEYRRTLKDKGNTRACYNNVCVSCTEYSRSLTTSSLVSEASLDLVI